MVQIDRRILFKPMIYFRTFTDGLWSRYDTNQIHAQELAPSNNSDPNVLAYYRCKLVRPVLCIRILARAALRQVDRLCVAP
jgi:hypothetical protein